MFNPPQEAYHVVLCGCEAVGLPEDEMNEREYRTRRAALNNLIGAYRTMRVPAATMQKLLDEKAALEAEHATQA